MSWSDPAPIPNCNVATPDFPALVIGFAKNPDNAAYDLIVFKTQEDFRHYRAMHVGAVRVIRDHADLKHVHNPIIRELYILSADTLEAEQDLTREEIVGRINLASLRANATPYEETIMGTSAAEGTATSESPKNSTEAKAVERAQKKAEAAQKKEAAKKEREAKRADGVIGNIRQFLEREQGATVDETLNHLVEKFPNRTRDGMSSTVKIQFSRLAKSTGRKIVNEKIVGRGRVYKFEDKGAIPGDVDKGEAKPAASAPASETPAAAATADTSDATSVGKKGARRPGGVKAEA